MLCPERRTETYSSLKDRGLRKIGHKISMVLDKRLSELVLIAVSYLVHYDTLLQNAAITGHYYKM